MKEFIHLTSEERERILGNHITTELLVDKTLINFENIEKDLSGMDLTVNFEVPPILIDNKHLAQIAAFSYQDKKGIWIRTMLRTYMEGGRVLYRKHDNDNFIVSLQF